MSTRKGTVEITLPPVVRSLAEFFSIKPPLRESSVRAPRRGRWPVFFAVVSADDRLAFQRNYSSASAARQAARDWRARGWYGPWVTSGLPTSYFRTTGGGPDEALLPAVVASGGWWWVVDEVQSMPPPSRWRMAGEPVQPLPVGEMAHLGEPMEGGGLPWA